MGSQMRSASPETHVCADAAPNLVDRIFDYILAELPEIADKVAMVKAGVCAEFCGEVFSIARQAAPGREGDDPVARMVRIADGRPSAGDLRALRQGFAAYLKGAGDLSLERCLRMPTTWNAWRRAQRDYWLCQAARHVDASGAKAGCAALLKEWGAFLSRGSWRHWRDDAQLPYGASKLSTALFWASWNNRGRALGSRQLERIVCHVFESKCPSRTPSL